MLSKLSEGLGRYYAFYVPTSVFLLFHEYYNVVQFLKPVKQMQAKYVVKVCKKKLSKIILGYGGVRCVRNHFKERWWLVINLLPRYVIEIYRFSFANRNTDFLQPPATGVIKIISR